MNKKTRQAVTIGGVILIIIGMFALYYNFKAPGSISSSNLDYIKSKCTTGAEVYNCGSYFCIDTPSGTCAQTEGNKCDYVSPEYICTGDESCIDTDGGQVYDVKGIVATGGSSYTDFCNGQALTEYSCVQGTFTTTTYLCPVSCDNGACKDGSPVCTPNWDCQAWSSCVSNTQTRLCNDLNDCGIQQGKPITSQTCTVGAVCGNSQCETGETTDNCPGDCPYVNPCLGTPSLPQCQQTGFFDKVKAFFSNTTNQIWTAVVIALGSIGGVIYYKRKK